MMLNPYVVPPFNGKRYERLKIYFWWSWHPLYPYWSKSCWGGVSEKQAWEVFQYPKTSALKYYHNKLIREDGNKLVEVADVPCQKLDTWRRIARDRNGWRKPTDAHPVKGWNKKFALDKSANL